MIKRKSKHKRIFEDNSLTDPQKYEKINNLNNKALNFYSVFIGLNAIIWPLLFIIPNVEIDNPNRSQFVALKE